MTGTTLTRSRFGGGFRVMVVLLLLVCPLAGLPGVDATRMSSPEAGANGAPAKAELCTACHGADGLPARANIPIIWGQEFYYLYVQLKDYKAGRRQNAEMGDIVESMSRQELRELAEYFAGKPWPATGFTADSVDVARGQTAAAAGVCVQCHLGGYEGNSRVPRLAGQQVGYLERTMLDFKGKTRMNSPAKASLLNSFEDDDITAMARYLAGH
jgi:cytochrome c553